MSRNASTGRARPLPPEERRLDIVTTAMAMLRRDHEMPSTRVLADECGIAEGTLFRAFATKEDLVDAILSTVACPHPFREATERIATIAAEPTPTTAGLRAGLLELTRLLHERFGEIFQILGPLGRMGPPPHHPHPGCPDPDDDTALDPLHYRTEFGRILAPYQPFLRVPTDTLLDAMRYLAFSGSHHHFNQGRELGPEAIVDLLLDGALAPDLRHTDPPRTTHDSEKESRC